MPPGNFAATLLMHPGGLPAEVALRSFVAALALYDTCVALTGRSESFKLKWPNDVLLNGGKLAGILLESGAAGCSTIFTLKTVRATCLRMFATSCWYMSWPSRLNATSGSI